MARTKREIEIGRKIKENVERGTAPGSLQFQSPKGAFEGACDVAAITGDISIDRATKDRAASLKSSIPDAWAADMIRDSVTGGAGRFFYVLVRARRI